MLLLDTWQEVCRTRYWNRLGSVLFEIVECVVEVERDVEIESRDGSSPAYWRNHEYDVAILQWN